MNRGKQDIANTAIRGWCRPARIVVLLVCTISLGCASTPGSVTESRIDCGTKQCAVACNGYEKAEAGSSKMQVWVGEMYATGQACFPRDEGEAVAWYRKSAAQGNAKAMYRLGEAYSNGRGVIRDEFEAMKWYRRAAESGDDKPFANLLNGHDAESATAAYRRLRANNAAKFLRDASPRLGEIELLSVSTHWRDGKAVLGKPRGGAGNVTGRLGSSGAVGGAMFLLGGPASAIFYGGLMALAAVKSGIEDGIAAGAIHEELDGQLAGTDLGGVLRKEMRNVLDESGRTAAPKVAPPGPDQATSKPGSGEVRIKVRFDAADLENVRRAWQFETDARPALVLTIKASVNASSPGTAAAPHAYELVYTGRTALDGLEDSFATEIRNAMRQFAGEILLELANIDDDELDANVAGR